MFSKPSAAYSPFRSESHNCAAYCCDLSQASVTGDHALPNAPFCPFVINSGRLMLHHRRLRLAALPAGLPRATSAIKITGAIQLLHLCRQCCRWGTSSSRWQMCTCGRWPPWSACASPSATSIPSSCRHVGQAHHAIAEVSLRYGPRTGAAQFIVMSDVCVMAVSLRSLLPEACKALLRTCSRALCSLRPRLHSTVTDW